MQRTGDPDVLELKEVPKPDPSDGQVLVRVRAAAVNPIEWKYRRGLAPHQLPAILGSDISGEVESSRTEEFAAGDDVFGLAASGAYAEYAAASAAAIAKKPGAISHEQAAAIPVAGMTAWQGLFDRGGLRAGQTALIAGAAGGVGHLAVQFAKHAGAHVIGTGSSRNREFVLGLGADEYIDYTQQDVRDLAAGVDVALDTVGGETTEALVAVLREGGVLVTIANAPPEDAARERGVRAEMMVMSPKRDQLVEIAELVAGGVIQVVVSEVLPLADAPRAHELSESGHARGKIVLTLD
jgi:NADPH:quinone reductase-like Zn-dependent oxidoreductase